MEKFMNWMLKFWSYICIVQNVDISYIIVKNIRYLRWNGGAWRFLHNTNHTIQGLGIQCINHLCDSCHLTDVNPHFTAPGWRYYFKINSCWPCEIWFWKGPWKVLSFDSSEPVGTMNNYRSRKCVWKCLQASAFLSQPQCDIPYSLY